MALGWPDFNNGVEVTRYPKHHLKVANESEIEALDLVTPTMVAFKCRRCGREIFYDRSYLGRILTGKIRSWVGGPFNMRQPCVDAG